MKNRLDFMVSEESFFTKFFKKYIWKALVSALGVLFLIFHEEIYVKLNLLPKKEKKN